MIEIHATALLLDMDGTLVDSRPVVERMWSEWSLSHGIDPARTLAVIHGRQGQDNMALLLPDRPHEENIAEYAELLERETVELDGVVALPGAVALLDALDGLPHALVTSAARKLATARMGAAGVSMPGVAVTAEDVAASKPDPEGYLRAAELLGVDPAGCVVMEDSATGIAAGLAAGMRVIGIGSHAQAATWVAGSPAAVRVAAGEAGGIDLSLDL